MFYGFFLSYGFGYGLWQNAEVCQGWRFGYGHTEKAKILSHWPREELWHTCHKYMPVMPFKISCLILLRNRVSNLPNFNRLLFTWNDSTLSEVDRKIYWQSIFSSFYSKSFYVSHAVSYFYSRVRNKHSPTLIIFLTFSRGYGLIPDSIEPILVV